MNALFSRMSSKPTARKRKALSNVRRGGSSFKRARTEIRVVASRPRPVNLGRGPIPDHAIVRLKYTQQFSSTGTSLDQIMNLNSLFDPDRTGTGHQPLGRDQYASFYSRYRVFRVFVKILAGVDPGISGVPGKITLVADNSVVPYTDAPTAAEQKYASVHGVAATGDITMIMRNYYLPSINGSTREQYTTDDRFQAAFGSNPTENICLHICDSTLTGAGYGAAGMKYTVQMTFFTELFDPVPLSAS